MQANMYVATYLFSDPLVSACTYGAGVISRQG
jgi:hypothetical protein